MQKHELKRTTKQAKRTRVGRGGKRGKTAGRGHKGQKQHGSQGIRPEMRDFIKKFPKLRGRGVNSNKSIKEKSASVNLNVLNESFKDNEKVSPKSLFAKGLIRKVSGKYPIVKILGIGDIDKKVTVLDCQISTSAKEKIEKAGGKVILN